MKFLIFSIFFSLITINPLIAECKDESTSSITNSNQSNLKELKVPAIGLKHLIGVTYNWAALLYEFRGYKRWKLSNSDNILWKNNHIDIGVVNSATPFFNMMGVYLEVEPIAILNLKFDLQKVHFFHLPVNSAFGYLYYPKEENDPDKINFEAEFREKRDELPATSTDGYRFKTTAELKLMVKKVAVNIVAQVKALTTTFSSTYVSDTQFSRALDTHEAINTFLSSFAKRERPIFFIEPKGRDRVVEIVSQRYTRTIKQKITDADMEEAGVPEGSLDEAREAIDGAAESVKTGKRQEIKTSIQRFFAVIGDGDVVAGVDKAVFISGIAFMAYLLYKSHTAKKEAKAGLEKTVMDILMRYGMMKGASSNFIHGPSYSPEAMKMIGLVYRFYNKINILLTATGIPTKWATMTEDLMTNYRRVSSNN